MKKLSILSALLFLAFTFSAFAGTTVDLKKKTSGTSGTEVLEVAKKTRIPEYKIPRVNKYLSKVRLPEYKIPTAE